MTGSPELKLEFCTYALLEVEGMGFSQNQQKMAGSCGMRSLDLKQQRPMPNLIIPIANGCQSYDQTEWSAWIVSQSPKIIDLEMLDTDYAQLVEVDPVTAQLTIKVEKQVYGYRRATRQDERDNLLCRIATLADLFTPADLEAIDDRTRKAGFSLQEDERRFIIDWLKWELNIDLAAQSSQQSSQGDKPLCD